MFDVCDDIQNRLQEFLEMTRDGYAIFDSNEYLIYCNPSFADLFSLDRKTKTPLHWEQILRTNFANRRGVRVDSGDIEQFIAYTSKVRRSRPYRLFEVDYFDGRWFLFSEQTNAKQELLMQIKEITSQKVIEESLQKNVSNLKAAALTDELTQVGNRRALVESVKSELSRCRRTGVSMTLLLFDLDFFKNVNDTYGHQAGDEVLQHVASLIKGAIRPYDILGRIGGEEFGVFLSNTNQKEAVMIANRTREAIAATEFEYQGQQIKLSVSVGVSTLGCDAEFEDLYQQADEALYESKHQGRNRVTAYKA
ncbi:diguanylate cyclase [Corallincola platygyrae]|uniref:diguanylate cyclase n=1 Tax=Corallincola platygyrae TaxID=1193278 RepID=A0ABW4XHZ6_9GAMM